MAEIIEGPDVGRALRERILIYGEPKTVKSSLALALPDDEYWGEIALIASDAGSEYLSSIPPAKRDRYHILKPGPDPGQNGKYDPAAEAFTLAGFDFTGKWPKVKTLVWDTMTETGRDILADIANKNQFSGSSGADKHIVIGDPGSPFRFSLPTMGDYGAAQNSLERLRKSLFRQPLHLIVICQPTIQETEAGAIVAGGPATVGKATMRDTAGAYDVVLRTEKKVTPQPGGSAKLLLLIHTEGTGIWLGGSRPNSEGKPNPMPKVEVGDDLTAFWHKYRSTFRPWTLTAAPVGASK